ncbi:5'/3'-nucleotidase SurE [Labilibaculum sp. K2S]|uniref:5'/3'-nucleotidase SurE n=1 Tax=Labilibaculum sp. K2S TaxID=3056386 RepID=UPI0025A31255|nr:5'/3'-nucleotidase SurE [Labilibaculum sp. K2S]MDM8159505.1 5'/3'-nucleotidase SurE [Labilibaculum sp. K2S]
MSELKEKPIILVTNDDGLNAKGIKALVAMVKDFGDIYVVAPNRTNSGKSNSITVEVPIRIKKVRDEENLHIYSCKGTPVDCVKLALNKILPRIPDFLVSGINHGANTSVSVLYSGTMGAAIEGCINGIPSIGFSLNVFDADADFTQSVKYGRKIFANLLQNGLSTGVCLNVNFPKDEIKGIRVCRQAAGRWNEEFDHRQDPFGGDYYWLTGHFKNAEPHNEETDEWAIKNGFASVVPTQIDMTAHALLEDLKKWNYEVQD